MTIVDRIFLLMEQNNMSAKDFAEKVGISQGNITDWKKGRSKPSVTALKKIADSFNISFDYLLGNIDRKSYVEELTKYLKLLNLTEREYDSFKKVAASFLLNEKPELTANIIKNSDLTKEETAQVFKALEILVDLMDSFEKTTDLNKIRSVMLGNDNFDNKDSYEFVINNSKTDETIKNGLIDALNNLNKLSIVQKNKIFMIPVLAKITTGLPILALEYFEGNLPIDPNIYGLNSSDDLFFLKISDESMNLKVHNGDYALIHKQSYAENGDIVVAFVNGFDEATLKRYKKINDELVMLEHMSTYPMEPLVINIKNTKFQIIGKAIGHFGKF